MITLRTRERKALDHSSHEREEGSSHERGKGSLITLSTRESKALPEFPATATATAKQRPTRVHRVYAFGLPRGRDLFKTVACCRETRKLEKHAAAFGRPRGREGKVKRGLPEFTKSTCSRLSMLLLMMMFIGTETLVTQLVHFRYSLSLFVLREALSTRERKAL